MTRWIAILVSLVFWAGAAYGVQSWRAQAEEEALFVALGNGEASPHLLARICSDAALIPRMKESLSGLEGDQRRHLLVRLDALKCLEEPSEEDQIALSEETFSWRLHFGDAPANAALLDLLEEDEESRELITTRLDELEGSQWARARTLALANLDAPWAEALLRAKKDPEVVSALWERRAQGQLSPGGAGERLLLAQWELLTEEQQRELTSGWLQASWQIRRAGALKQPLVIGYKICFTPPSEVAFPALKAIAIPQRFDLNERPLKVERQAVVEHLGAQLLEAPGCATRTLDLSPAFVKHGRFKLEAILQAALIPSEASEEAALALLTTGERPEGALAWQSQPFSRKAYRIFLGAESGPPNALHKADLDKAVHASLLLDLSLDGARTPIWREGALQKISDPLPLRHGDAHSLLLSSKAPLSAALSFRVQGQRAGGPWRDLGEGHLPPGRHEPQAPLSVPISLAPVCPKAERCKISLRLRPSLRVARTVAEISDYWAEYLSLGALSLDVQNHAEGAHWGALYEAFKAVNKE